MSSRPSFPAKLPSISAKATPSAQASNAPIATKNIAVNAQPERLGGTFSSHKTPPQGHGLDSGAVRARMVHKLAQQGVRDAQVLSAMGTVERHRFVDSALVNQAYEDTSLPIGLGQTISKPNVVARMIELLRNGAAPGTQLGRVLEIGTGCGYQAAVLSLLASEVYSIERLRGLHERARENLRPLRVRNLHLLLGDGMLGYAKGAPYAAIISAAGGEAIPQAWTDQLAVGGRLVAPTVTASGAQALVVVDRVSAHPTQGLQHSVLEAVNFVPLKSGIA
jgi:protein-L-isoaspartate(D-aspartate) O-methyltransferase